MSRRHTPIDRTEVRLETGGPRDCCQSNLYNFGSNELNDHLHRSHPEGTPHHALHTSKLKEVLGDPESPVDELPDPTNRLNHLFMHNGRARSDDFERESSSS